MNEEILGGLKSAIERNESLKKAMMTFYNAGYKKEEIEEAARFLSQNPIPAPSQTLPVVQAEPAKPKQGLFQKKEAQKLSSPKTAPTVPSAVPVAPLVSPQPAPSTPLVNKQIVSNYGNQIQKPLPQNQQKVSNYTEKKSNDTVLIVILIIILVLLFGILASIFLFKNQIINFLSSMFG